MPKIGIVTSWQQACGICTYSQFLGEELQKQGADVTILAERKDVLPKGFDPNFKSELKHIECWSRNEPFDELVKTAKKEKFDILHLQHQFGLFPFGNYLEKLLSELNPLTKTVITLHDVVGRGNAQMEQYFGAIIKYADKIIVHTPLCYDLLVREWGCPKEKLIQIVHGTKLIKTPSKSVARKKLKLSPDAQVILSWGFIWESKGINQILDVFAQVLKTYPKAVFIHAGGLHPVFSRGEYLKGLITQAFRLGITPENFKITGFVNEDQLLLYFGACDLIVLNYMRGSASASGAAHRALAAGKPIVGSDDYCITEIPKLEYPRTDVNGLYRGILQGLGDKRLQN